MQQIRIVTIQFNQAGRTYLFNAGSLELKPGDRVMVESERGLSPAFVLTSPQEHEHTDADKPLPLVVRLLNIEDEQTLALNSRREKEAFEFCQQRVKERSMEMKLVRVEQLFDSSKTIFYFTADGRVDFRELVKDLAHTFHTRIEMRQIGVRDEAKMVGGIGICGRTLCCASFLRDFQPVSVKMAKEQNLALNPSKISGQCGRLLCCLDYEYETYCELRKSFPKFGKLVRTVQQQTGTVEKVNLLTSELTLRLPDDKLISVKLAELTETAGLAAPRQIASEQIPQVVKVQDREKQSSPSKDLKPDVKSDSRPVPSTPDDGEQKADRPEDRSKRKKQRRPFTRRKSDNTKNRTPGQE